MLTGRYAVAPGSIEKETPHAQLRSWPSICPLSASSHKAFSPQGIPGAGSLCRPAPGVETMDARMCVAQTGSRDLGVVKLGSSLAVVRTDVVLSSNAGGTLLTEVIVEMI